MKNAMLPYELPPCAACIKADVCMFFEELRTLEADAQSPLGLSCRAFVPRDDAGDKPKKQRGRPPKQEGAETPEERREWMQERLEEYLHDQG